MKDHTNEEWDDLEAMLDDIGKHVARGAKDFYCSDHVGSHYGWVASTGSWYIRASHLSMLLRKIVDPVKRNIYTQSFSTSAGRRDLCKAFLSLTAAPPSQPNRFERDDVI